MKRRFLVLVTFLAASLLAAQPSDPLEGLPNYYRLRPDIATAGQPSDEALEAVQEAGFKAVLNLRTEQEGSLTKSPKWRLSGWRISTSRLDARVSHRRSSRSSVTS